MKIALVCDWYHPRVGGIELHLQDLAARLTTADHDVVVITPTPGPATVDGIRVRRIDAPRAPVFGFLTTPGGVSALADVLASERADVAHCHVSIVSPAALGGALHAVRLRIPVVMTFHSIVPQTHLLARAANVALRTSSWPAVFSAVSARVARDVRPIAGARTIAVLPNGIDAGAWRVEPVADGGDSTRLITVMRLNAKKRPLLLAVMMRRLARLLGETATVSLRVIGDGPQRPRLERAIANAGLTARVQLLGRQTRDEIRQHLAASDLFVLPTVRESFGLAALEARCAGLPVVAMRASGVAELIEHGREGLLADSDEDFAVQVASLIRDPERRREMARHNRATTPPFDWARTIDAHLALYREAIALRDTVCAEMKA